MLGLNLSRERQQSPFPCAHTQCQTSSPFQTDAGLCQSVGVKFSLCRQLSWETENTLRIAPSRCHRGSSKVSYARADMHERERKKKSLSTQTDEVTLSTEPCPSSALPCRQWPGVTVGSIPNLFNYIWECLIERLLGGKIHRAMGFLLSSTRWDRCRDQSGSSTQFVSSAALLHARVYLPSGCWNTTVPACGVFACGPRSSSFWS